MGTDQALRGGSRAGTRRSLPRAGGRPLNVRLCRPEPVPLETSTSFTLTTWAAPFAPQGPLVRQRGPHSRQTDKAQLEEGCLRQRPDDRIPSPP